MKKFRYRLQALLKVKEHIEKERQKKLALTTKRVQDQEDVLREIDNCRDATKQHQRLSVEGPFTVAEMLVISRYMFKLKRDTIMGQELLKALRKEEAGRRQELLEATRERKKYDKLKELQEEEHYKSMESALAKESDETGITGFRQKQANAKA
jgi:flagellar FliJ protein